MSKVEKVMVKMTYKWLSLDDARKYPRTLILSKDNLDKATALPLFLGSFDVTPKITSIFSLSLSFS